MKRRSLVLITVDCLRADHVGFLGYTRAVTPFLDSLAKTSVVFSNAIVAGAPTYFSFPAIMASRYPLGLGREIVGIAPREPTIAGALRAAGYTSAAFLGGNPYLSSRFGYDQGFERFNDFLDSDVSRPMPGLSGQGTAPFSRLNRIVESVARRNRLSASGYDELYFWYCQWRSREEVSMDRLRRYPSADVLVSEACAWLEEVRQQPFFLWIHLMDPHHPYYPPPDALLSLGINGMSASRSRFLNSFWNRGDVKTARLQRYRSQILALYDAGVHWADKQIARLVDTLRRLQHWDDTLFAVTADHGEEFLEHGERYHSPTSLPEELIRVPLLVRAPESNGTILQAPFSLIHLAPTLLQAVESDIPETFQGRSYWAEISAGEFRPEPAIVECAEGCSNPLRMEDRMRPRLMAIRDGDYKLVFRFSDQTDRLYDLKSDPTERSPLEANDRAPERKRLLQVAGEHLRKSRERRNTALAMHARVREIRQSIEVRRGHPRAAQEETVPGKSGHG